MELRKSDQIKIVQKFDIKELINLIKNLIKVIGEENEILQGKQGFSYQEIVSQKLALAQSMESISLQVKDNPDLLAHIDISKKTELKVLYQKLDVLKNENSLHLRASIYSNKKISEIIKKILINRVKMKSGYCNKGLYNSSIKFGNKVPAISHNTTN